MDDKIIIIIIISKSYTMHVSNNKILKALSIFINTEREIIESYEFLDPIM